MTVSITRMPLAGATGSDSAPGHFPNCPLLRLSDLLQLPGTNALASPTNLLLFWLGGKAFSHWPTATDYFTKYQPRH